MKTFAQYNEADDLILVNGIGRMTKAQAEKQVKEMLADMVKMAVSGNFTKLQYAIEKSSLLTHIKALT